jgi:hypothetical protein
MIASERIIDRAVAMWRLLLTNPKFDNGDDSSAGGVGFMLAILANQKANNTDENLDAFAKELKGRILAAKESEYFDVRWLEVDYAPCSVLAESANAVGLAIPVWPCKTRVTIDSDYMCVQSGYGASRQYHYPPSDGKWLITDLLGGDDLKKLITMIEGDDLLASNFRVGV